MLKLAEKRMMTAATAPAKCPRCADCRFMPGVKAIGARSVAEIDSPLRFVFIFVVLWSALLCPGIYGYFFRACGRWSSIPVRSTRGTVLGYVEVNLHEVHSILAGFWRTIAAP